MKTLNSSNLQDPKSKVLEKIVQIDEARKAFIEGLTERCKSDAQWTQALEALDAAFTEMRTKVLERVDGILSNTTGYLRPEQLEQMEAFDAALLELNNAAEALTELSHSQLNKINELMSDGSYSTADQQRVIGFTHIGTAKARIDNCFQQLLDSKYAVNK